MSVVLYVSPKVIKKAFVDIVCSVEEFAKWQEPGQREYFYRDADIHVDMASHDIFYLRTTKEDGISPRDYTSVDMKDFAPNLSVPSLV